jgi:hypothetical protein
VATAAHGTRGACLPWAGGLLTSFYHELRHDRGAIDALLRKDGFRWSPNAEVAFHALQHALTTASVLQLLDFDHEFSVECDASGSGLDAVLHQGAGQVAFFSRTLVPRHMKLAAYERELIGLVQVVRHWRPYLWGHSFLIKTDHYSLKFLLDQRLSTIPQHQWASKLIGFNFRVEYKSGSSNVVADALSRHDTEESVAVMALSAPSFQLFDDLRQQLSSDLTLIELMAAVQAGQGRPMAGRG